MVPTIHNYREHFEKQHYNIKLVINLHLLNFFYLLIFDKKNFKLYIQNIYLFENC